VPQWGIEFGFAWNTNAAGWAGSYGTRGDRTNAGPDSLVALVSIFISNELNLTLLNRV